MQLRKKEFRYEDFDMVSSFASNIGSADIVNVQLYGLNLNWVVVYWDGEK